MYVLPKTCGHTKKGEGRGSEREAMGRGGGVGAWGRAEGAVRCNNRTTSERGQGVAHLIVVGARWPVELCAGCGAKVSGRAWYVEGPRVFRNNSGLMETEEK